MCSPGAGGDTIETSIKVPSINYKDWSPGPRGVSLRLKAIIRRGASRTREGLGLSTEY
jgi:hypothetical protein